MHERATAMTTVERVMLLKGVDLFAALDGEDLAEIAAIASEVRVPAGELILAEGETGEALYIVVEGTVRVMKGERVLAELGEREVFGEMALLDPAPRSASVVASRDALLLRVERDDFADILQARPEVPLGVIRVLARRLRGAIE